jgi:hypothetical protein
MRKFQKARSPQETTQFGLRILARIIAREAVKARLAKVDGLNPDPVFVEATPAPVGEYLKGAAPR